MKQLTSLGYSPRDISREFELLRMKEAKTIKEYFDRLLVVVNKIRLLREDLPNKRIVEKMLVSLPERFEAKISSLEDSRDLTQISLTELVDSLQTQEHRIILRQESSIEGAFQAKEIEQTGINARKAGLK